MKIYNTLKKKKQEFKPIKEGEVKMYVCGPTVYDLGHLGHGRAATVFDMIRKYLEYKGNKVNFVTNYTDIDDKMINRAKEKGISVSELAAQIIPEYEHDFAAIGIKLATKQTRATDYIQPMIDLIKKLEEIGAAYVLKDGVYFDIKKFKKYGKLSGQSLKDLQMGARVDVNEEKRNPQDFVLWKFEKPGEPSWDSPWGKGRPGWHLECSAMVKKELGETIDIHGGGQDLIFPHHECEVAQSEAANGCDFANFWVHNGFVNINKEKMSKSLHNFVTLRDVLNKYPGQVLRLFYLQKHYRAPLDFSEEALEQAKNGLKRVHDFSLKLVQAHGDGGNFETTLKSAIEKFVKKFEKAMDDDFETPSALAALFDFISDVNKFLEKGLSQKSKDEILAVLNRVDEVLGIVFSSEKMPLEVVSLANERLIERKNRNFARSDELRKEIIAKGYDIEDTKDGFILKKI
ncbi:MAG: cysteinyl-tRNA synthetase, cysteinyl-tRNA synthetase [Candidatus Peregrinibacteria bacterium GW2011_GWF2_38_29]|nr:MAG: cysteinyl-tRNA synthetase, cysteinyl-tRNA synthetase [Candidatus Peregrinibacteria bacterium GW2011_GWF2_38_29]HBB02956.1 cysteine--tRNA ligase [Candidatus Peregrinibacteria bacterium]